MPKQYDDLFESSKMSFGEHLEELRVALFKAIIALVAGFIVGLYWADDLVRTVKAPLQTALDEFQMNRVQERYIAEIRERIENGESVALPPRKEDESDEDLLIRASEMYAAQRLVPRKKLYSLDELRAQGFQIDDLPDRRTLSDGTELIELTMLDPIADDPRRDLISTQITGGFSVFMRAAFILGLIISSPFVIYFIWQFVAAGLYPHERHYFWTFFFMSVVLFLSGAALAYFVALYYVVRFLFFFYAWLDVTPYPAVNDWLAFIMILPIGFGISFQLPLVMLFLERIGMFTVKTFLQQWRMAVLAISAISVVLTPADPQSMILMAVPLVILYFGGIALCRYFPRRRTPFGEAVDDGD